MASQNKIEVRVGAAGDAATFGRLLYAFNVEFDEETPDPDVIAERAAPLMDSGEMVALFVGKAPEGFAQLRFRPSLYGAGRDACLEELYVLPERRGAGLGRALLDAAMEHARSRGADHIEVTTSEADTAALGLYESSGFTNRERGPGGPRMLYYERDL
jgi:ribosomal protein S18 acetylase RimI-like enzyme